MRGGIVYSIFVFFTLSIFSQIIPDVVISTQGISNLYNPKNLRDPMTRPSFFTPSTLNYSYTTSTTSTRTTNLFAIENLVLSGIIRIQNIKEALLADKITGEIYVVRGGKIYTIDRKSIDGYSAVIGMDKVVIYSIKEKKNFVFQLKKGGDEP